MKAITISILFIILCAFFGCKKDRDLQKSIFQPDPEFPDLPAYSEWGYNTFGAYYDRQVFIYTNADKPIKIIVRNDSTFFNFSGELGNYDKMIMTFTMNDFLPTQYQDLIALDKKVIDLSNPAYGVQIQKNDLKVESSLLDGTLEFKRAQNLIVDKIHQEVILSGLFEFRILINSVPYSISDGRFDLGIDKNNFYVL